MVKLNKKQRKALRTLAKLPAPRKRKEWGHRINTRIEQHAR